MVAPNRHSSMPNIAFMSHLQNPIRHRHVMVANGKSITKICHHRFFDNTEACLYLIWDTFTLSPIKMKVHEAAF